MKTRQMAALENNLQAEMARVNGVPADWRRTVIAETETSVLTDPLNSRYWRGSFDQVRDFPIGDDRSRRARGIVRGLEKIAGRQRTRTHMGHRRVAFDQEGLLRRYVPNQREHVTDAMSRLYLELASRQRSRASYSWWGFLTRYTNKFPKRATVRDLDSDVLSLALRHLSEGKI